MPTAFIRHRVQDYEKWRQVYDEFTQPIVLAWRSNQPFTARSRTRMTYS